MLQNQQYNANTGLNLKFLNNSLHAYEMCAHAQHVAAVNPKVTSLLAFALCHDSWLLLYQITKHRKVQMTVLKKIFTVTIIIPSNISPLLCSL